MATAVLYEEDISLPADQSDPTGDLPEVDVVTSALNPTATTKPPRQRRPLAASFRHGQSSGRCWRSRFTTRASR
jgi:hypothetical protein